jgi:hypothetical protein
VYTDREPVKPSSVTSVVALSEVTDGGQLFAIV